MKAKFLREAYFCVRTGDCNFFLLLACPQLGGLLCFSQGLYPTQLSQTTKRGKLWQILLHVGHLSRIQKKNSTDWWKHVVLGNYEDDSQLS